MVEEDPFIPLRRRRRRRRRPRWYSIGYTNVALGKRGCGGNKNACQSGEWKKRFPRLFPSITSAMERGRGRGIHTMRKIGAAASPLHLCTLPRSKNKWNLRLERFPPLFSFLSHYEVPFSYDDAVPPFFRGVRPRWFFRVLFSS